MLYRLGRYIIVAAFLSLLFVIYPTTKIVSANEDGVTSVTGTEEVMLYSSHNGFRTKSEIKLSE